jgi:hypothetical protein
MEKIAVVSIFPRNLASGGINFPCIVESMSESREIPLLIHNEDNGSVAIFEEGRVPFPVRRAFAVFAKAGQLRGSIEVTMDDGYKTVSSLLSPLSHGLVIPPMTWAIQKYLTDDATLLVVCDKLFDEDDYIRDRGNFLSVIGLDVNEPARERE